VSFIYSRESSCGELRFEGISGSPSSAITVGKLCIWNSQTYVPDTAILCLFDPESANFAAELIAQRSPSGIIVSSSSLSSKLLCVLMRSQIPHLVLKESHYSLLEHNGRICLLDTQKSVLVVNPSIETLDLYPHTLPNSLISRARDEDLTVIKERNGKGILIDSLPYPEALLEIAEKNCATRITVGLSVPSERFGEDEFCEYTEAAFCSAVYGNISIMLRDFSTHDELERAYSLMNKVFCSLEERGREFNGYIRKGIMISAPSLLLLPRPSRSPDFICIDADTLFSHLLACDVDALQRRSDTLHALCEIWTRYVSISPSRAPLYVRSERLCSCTLLDSFCLFAKVEEIYPLTSS